MIGKMDFVGSPPRMGAVIRGQKPVTCLSFHEDGVHLFICSEKDSKIRLIDCHRGVCDQPAIRCEREGIRLVESTHHNYSVLISGTGKIAGPPQQRNAVHYLSLYDNKLLRSFRGHTDEVVNISMCPVDDTFLSSSKDGTARLWNLQQAGCLGQLDLPPNIQGPPRANYDSTGLVFGVTAKNDHGHLIHLYDARKYSGGAFAELTVNQDTIEKAIQKKTICTPDIAYELSRTDWTSMAFNAQGNKLLITAEKGLGLLLDGFNGSVTEVLVDNTVSSKMETRNVHPLAACFTSDDKTVLGSCDNDGTICCWDVNNGRLLRRLSGHTGGNVGAIACNPKLALLATSCVNTSLWIW